MVLRKLLGGLFGGDGERSDQQEAGEAVDYNGYSITPLIKREGGQYMTAGVIRKTIDGELKEQEFVRADRHSSADDAKQLSLAKGRQIIDEQGDRLFQQ